MNKRGITVITLVLVIAIITLFTTTVVFTGSDSIGSAAKEIFFTEVSQIEALVSDYKLRNNNKLDFAETQFNISSLSTEEKEQFEDEPQTASVVSLYVVDLDLISAGDTKYGNSKSTDDIYMVSDKTGKVYYKKGVNIDDYTYYTIVH